MAQGFVVRQFDLNAAALTGTVLAPNVVTSSLTAVGALDTGSIVAGFSGIDGTPIGVDTPASGRFTDIDVDLVAVLDNVHAVRIGVDAAGFGDVQAFDIVYETGAISDGDANVVFLVNIDASGSAGGSVAALGVLAITGLAEVFGLAAGVGVNPIIQLSGVFGDMDSALVKAVDRLAEFISTGSDIVMFVANGDTVTIGNATKFQQIEFLLAVEASGAGIKPIFEFSTGVGTWALFIPVDATNGMKNSGGIVWLNSDIPSWATGTGGEYLIRITRDQVSLTASPTESLVQISSPAVFTWDKDGLLTVAGLDGVIGGNTPAAGDFVDLSASGTLAGAGDFAINTNKFMVAALSGNTVVAGTLGVAGVASFATTVSMTGGEVLAWGGQVFIDSVGANDMFFRPNQTTGMTLTPGGNLVLVGNLNALGTGPHAIGGVAVGQDQFLLQGAYNSTGVVNRAAIFDIVSTLTGADGDTAGLIGANFRGTMVTQTIADENVAIIAQVSIIEPQITNNLTGSGIILVAASLYIVNAPTEGETNAALYVASGAATLLGDVGIGALAVPSVFGLFGPATSVKASARLPHGSAPTSPVDGDEWTTTVGKFIRINGVTEQFAFV